MLISEAKRISRQIVWDAKTAIHNCEFHTNGKAQQKGVAKSSSHNVIPMVRGFKNNFVRKKGFVEVNNESMEDHC